MYNFQPNTNKWIEKIYKMVLNIIYKMLNYNMPKIRKKSKSRLLNTYVNASGKHNQVRWTE